MFARLSKMEKTRFEEDRSPEIRAGGVELSGGGEGVSDLISRPLRRPLNGLLIGWAA